MHEIDIYYLYSNYQKQGERYKKQVRDGTANYNKKKLRGNKEKRPKHALSELINIL